MNQEIIDYIKKSKKKTWLKWHGTEDQEIIAELLKINYPKEDIYNSYKYLIEQEGHRIFLGGIFLYATHLFVTKKRQLEMIKNILDAYTQSSHVQPWSDKTEKLAVILLVLFVSVIIIASILTGTIWDILEIIFNR